MPEEKAIGLGGTAITIEQVQRLLQKKFSTNNTIKSHNDIVVADGKGFVSDIVRIELTWAGKSKNGQVTFVNVSICVEVDPALPKTVVAKVPNLNKLKALVETLGEQETERAKSLFDKMDVVKHVCCIICLPI